MNLAGILILLHDSRGITIEEAEHLHKEATDLAFIVCTGIHWDTELTNQNLVSLSCVEAVFITSLEALGHTQKAIVWALNELIEVGVQRVFALASIGYQVRFDYEAIEVLRMFQKQDVVLRPGNEA